MPEAHMRIRNILIAGGGVDGWLAAAVLARTLRAPRYAVRLIDPPRGASGHDLGLAGLSGGQASLPSIRGLHGLLGLDEDVLFRQARAAVSLGVAFSGWSPNVKTSFHPFGDFGAAMDGVAFHNYWLKMRDEADTGPFDAYALAAQAARLGRFVQPSDDPGSVLSTFTYAYHWDAAAYAGVLRALAEKAGVERIEGTVEAVRPDARAGFIGAVTLDDGRELQADLYIDASGPDGVLISALPGGDFESWSDWLACDRAMAVRCDEDGLDTPFNQVRAHGAGWGWRMPLGDSTGYGLVWSGDHLSDEAAQKLLSASLGGEPVGEPSRTAFASGRRTRPWTGNCVAVGASASVLDPLVPTALQLTQSSLWTLLTLLPDLSFDGGEAEEYNRLMIATMERMRDFIILRYRLTGRTDTPFWTHCAEMAPPDFLAYRMRLFESRGRLLLRGEDTFGEADWSGAWLGQGVTPRMHDPLADTLPRDQVRARLLAMRRAISAAAEAMPTHRAFIEQRLKGA